MQILQTNSQNLPMSGKLFIGSPILTKYMWNNIIIEQRSTHNWAHRLYNNSILHNIIAVLSSPIV